jgi:GH18 family chitinase
MFDCVGYYSCKTGEPTKVTPCPSGTIFDADLQTCNWPWATTCQCTSATIFEQNNTPSSSETPRPSPVLKYTCKADERNTVNFGYYQSWSKGRWSECNPVHPGAIDVESFGYTHLAFAFAGVSWTGELEPYDGDESFIPMYESFNGLKKRNPELKTLIAVGGWTFEQKRFVTASSTEAKRTKFAASVVRFLQAYGFDGIDLDWE